jgi:pyridoxine 4-dehydrogenase
MKVLQDLVNEGKIGGIQLSEAKAETIRRAAKVSLWATDIFENGVAETCAQLGITVVAHTPLGAGMLTGQIKSLADMPANDHHRHFPRFQPENLQKNLDLVVELSKLADSKGCTTAQLALCWIKSRSKTPGMPVIIPVFGSRSEERVKENTKEVDLTAADLKAIDNILDSFPVAGHRYPEAAAKLAKY